MNWGNPNLTEPLHKKVTLVRNKHLAHRDKKHTWQTLMQQTGLTPDNLDHLICSYFTLAEDVSRMLDIPLDFPEALVKTNIINSIMDVRNALSLYRQQMDDPHNITR
jgi:transposase-like protein